MTIMLLYLCISTCIHLSTYIYCYGMTTNTGKYYIYVLVHVYIYAYVYTAMVWLLIPVTYVYTAMVWLRIPVITMGLYHTVVFPIILVQYT